MFKTYRNEANPSLLTVEFYSMEGTTEGTVTVITRPVAYWRTFWGELGNYVKQAEQRPLPGMPGVDRDVEL